jgi:hypothetical protein
MCTPVNRFMSGRISWLTAEQETLIANLHQA